MPLVKPLPPISEDLQIKIRNAHKERRDKDLMQLVTDSKIYVNGCNSCGNELQALREWVTYLMHYEFKPPSYL